MKLEGTAQSGSGHQLIHLPVADALSNLNTTFMENTGIYKPHSGLFRQSLGNVEDRVSKAIFSLKREIHISFHLIFIVKNLNFRLH